MWEFELMASVGFYSKYYCWQRAVYVRTIPADADEAVYMTIFWADKDLDAVNFTV